GVVPFVVTFGVIAVLMLLEPHVSGTVLIFTLAAIMMFVGGTRFRWFGLAAAAAAVAVGIFLIMPGGLSYARERIDIWLDPYVDPQGDGFQTIQSLIAIGSGGIMGKGLGDSRQKYLYIPEPQNDFIFAVVCEELGFVGATIIIILFALLVWRGFIIAMRAKDKFGSMLAVGLTMQVGIQTLLNIAVVTNTVPNTGISLPFFSYGGTALLMLLFQMGVVLSISREARIDK
ncbi:MAG: FtsW/RodA/SpoVE family cell cycle protein, partial [Oscillospiraceae bacterium]|nr:FtsW/RodA/SpoVE family cell cycle protein [Oscillospiraceae bacterium]